MPVPKTGAQRASSTWSARLTVFTLAFALMAAIGIAANPTSTAAAGIKVVVVVGPVESSTAKYISTAKRYAAQARSYGASVTEIYSPNATWAKVKAAAQGAKVLIYLGHGNGSPNPYGPWSKYTKDGMGLNAAAGKGNSNTKYYGEYYFQTQVKLAANAVVILNHLCYASGNSEPGRADPTRDVAKQRVDNFGAGFLRTGAKAVFAEGHSDAGYILYNLFKTKKTIGQIFSGSANWDGRYDFQFQSRRNAQFRAWMDPKAPTKYYRSVIGNLGLSSSTFRSS